MGEEFFDHEEVRGGCEGGIEGQDWAGASETVAGEVELGHCVDCIHIAPLAEVRTEKCSWRKRTVLQV